MAAKRASSLPKLTIVLSSYAFMYIKKETAITDSGAKDFISGIYGRYNLEYHFNLLGIFLRVCLVLCAICFKIETFNKTLGKSREKDIRHCRPTDAGRASKMSV